MQKKKSLVSRLVGVFVMLIFFVSTMIPALKMFGLEQMANAMMPAQPSFFSAVSIEIIDLFTIVALTIGILLVGQFVALFFIVLLKPYIFETLEDVWNIQDDPYVIVDVAQSYFYVTAYPLATKILPRTLAIAMVVVIVILPIALFITEFSTAFVLAILSGMAISTVVLTIRYYWIEWVRVHKVLRFMEHEVKYPRTYRLKITGPLVLWSRTDYNVINEMADSDDPEEIESEYGVDLGVETSPLMDLIIGFANNILRKNIKTLYLPALLNETDDIVLWLPNTEIYIDLISFMKNEAKYLSETEIESRISQILRKNVPYRRRYQNKSTVGNVTPIKPRVRD